MKRILFAFQQAGGANALLPLIRELSAAFEVVITGRDLVCDHLVQRGVPVRRYPELGWDGSPSAPLPEGLAKNPPALIITDTIALERAKEGIACRTFWRWAKELGVPSIAYVDCWWGYDMRFRLPGETTPPVMPDRIAAIDPHAGEDMTAMGFPEEKIFVTGSPWFAQLARPEEERDSEETSLLKNEFGIAESFVILFVSQPLEKTFGSESVYGFTERTAFTELLGSLCRLPEGVKETLSLVVLLHPEEEESILRSVIEESPCPFSVVFRKGEPHRTVTAADLVTGMFSILLAEAVLLNRPVVSIQPNLTREEILVTNMIGATPSVTTQEELDRVMLSCTTSPGFRARLLQRQRRFRAVTDSITRWRKLIDSTTAGSSQSNKGWSSLDILPCREYSGS